MTEPTPGQHAVDPTQPVVMPTSSLHGVPDATSARLQALHAGRASSASATSKATADSRSNSSGKAAGPAPSRIIAAAASVSAGIGLVAFMAGAQQDIVVQINPTPITWQPVNAVVEMGPAVTSGDRSPPAEVGVRVVEAATPAEWPVPEANVATQSEGS